jgi:hypothetical protein
MALAIGLLCCGASGVQARAGNGEPKTPGTVRSTPPEPADELIVGERSLGYRVPQESSDVCAVDKGNLGDGDPVYLIEGRRVGLHWPGCYQVFLRDPQTILAQIRPRGAFLGDLENSTPLRPVWFLAGLYILTGLVSGALCAQMALHRGRNPSTWFALGFVFNLFGCLALSILPPGGPGLPDRIPQGLGKFHTTASPVPCSHCGAKNHPTARKCSRCGRELTPAVESEVMRAGLGASARKTEARSEGR